MEVQLFLTSALDGGEGLTSQIYRLNLGKIPLYPL